MHTHTIPVRRTTVLQCLKLWTFCLRILLLLAQNKIRGLQVTDRINVMQLPQDTASQVYVKWTFILTSVV